MSQLTKNVLYSLLLTFARFFFPLVTYPYISRVLGPDKVGILNFSENYSNYFVFIAALGIPLYGVREIAKIKNDGLSLNKAFSEIAIIHLFSSIACLGFFLLTVFYIPRLNSEFEINLLFGANIIINFFSFEWYLIGIEKFKIIALRSIATKFLPIALMFFLVKTKDDYVIYQSLNTLAFALNAITNIVILRKYIKFDPKGVELKKHMAPLLTVFFSSAFITFYSMTDSLVLGFVSGFTAVGFYATAIKLNKIISLIIASIGNVLVPRISHLHATGAREQIESVISKSLRFTIFLTVPLTVGLFLLSKELIAILAGQGFEASVAASQILSPIIVLMGLSNVFGIQVLLPFSKERYLLIVFLTGTILSVALNIPLTHFYGHLGAAATTLVTEVVMTVLSFHYFKKVLIMKIPWKYFGWCVVLSALFVPVVYYFKAVFDNEWLVVALSVLTCSLLYVGLQFLLLRRYLRDEVLDFASALVKKS
jgi:O-antigen/teichoic acid export membrane protein